MILFYLKNFFRNLFLIGVNIDSPAAPAAALLSGVLSVIYGGIFTGCVRYADILGLFRIPGIMSIMIFWAVLESPKLSARSGIQSGSRQQARAWFNFPAPREQGRKATNEKKPDFRIEPANRNGIRGFLLHQMDGSAVLMSQFIPAEAFPDFISESGINAEQISLEYKHSQNSPE